MTSILFLFFFFFIFLSRLKIKLLYPKRLRGQKKKRIEASNSMEKEKKIWPFLWIYPSSISPESSEISLS